MFCVNCGTEIPDDAQFCPGCGAKAGQPKPKTVFCRNCGESISEDAIVCPKCGVATDKFNSANASQQPNIAISNENINSINMPWAAPPPKSKTAAFVLAILLGWLGAHRFYVGKIGTGILWFLTFGIGGIGWIVDIIMIALDAFRDKYGYLLV